MRVTYRHRNRHKKHILKIVLAIVGILVVIALSVAIFIHRDSLPIPFLHRPVTMEKFSEIIAETGLTVEEDTNTYNSESGITSLAWGRNDDTTLSYDLYTFQTEEMSINQYNDLIEQIENGGHEGLASNTKSYGKHSGLYTAETSHIYFVIYRAKNTVVFGTSTIENKNTVDDCIKKLK